MIKTRNKDGKIKLINIDCRINIPQQGRMPRSTTINDGCQSTDWPDNFALMTLRRMHGTG